MADSIPHLPHILVGGLAVGWLAMGLHVLPGAHLLIYAAPIAVAVLGQLVLSSWRSAAGADRLEPIIGYLALVVTAWLVFGILFAPTAFSSRLSDLLAISMLLPVIVDWLHDRQILKSGEDEAEMDESAPHPQHYE